MVGMLVISYVSLSARASDVTIWLYVDYSETSYESAPSTVYHKDLDAVLDDFESHHVSEEYRKILALVHWPYRDNYMTWFYMVSHFIMTPDAFGR